MVNITEKYAAMPSSKHSGRRSRTQMLVVHSAESPLQRGYAKSLTNWSNSNPQILSSWNTFVDPGVCVRAVNTYNAAWHASWANGVSVGYEQAAYAAFSRDEWMTLEGRRMLERLAIEMAADAGIFDIPLRWLTGAQVNAVRAGNTKIKGLAAHRQVDPAYRTDPGDGFPYGYLLKRIKAHTNGIKPAAATGPEPVPNLLEEIMALDRNSPDYRNLVSDIAKAVLNEPIGYTEDKQQFGSYVLRTDNNVEQIERLVRDLPKTILNYPVELQGIHSGTTDAKTKIAWQASELQQIRAVLTSLTEQLSNLTRCGNTESDGTADVAEPPAPPKEI